MLIKRCLFPILIFALLMTILPADASAIEYTQTNPFHDVEEGDFYFVPALWAYKRGISNGHGSNETFMPDLGCTRAEIVTFLWRFDGSPATNRKLNQFVDIDTGTWYGDAVIWAAANNITNGYGNYNTFRPELQCSRGEIITFLYRMYGSPPVTGPNPFLDVPDNAYFSDAVIWAHDNGITTGTSNSLFSPSEICTRGQAVSFIWRAWWNDNMSSDKEAGRPINVHRYGISENNTGKENSIILQKIIDDISDQGMTVYFPSGNYYFASNGSQRIGNHCIKMRSGVNIVGDGESTVLMPVGTSDGGIDMFYFNDYIDNLGPNYLENCEFENFKIDASGTSCSNYTSAGKGFMLNLIKNCHWRNVTVAYTDATGFGMDCPIDCSITNCKAINCGKAATSESEGASGFGIGFGYSNYENMIISGCKSECNTKYGFFFEHQARFKPHRYTADAAQGFTVINCYASSNLYNFGGINAINTVYRNCTSANAVEQGFYFMDSDNCIIIDCIDNGATVDKEF